MNVAYNVGKLSPRSTKCTPLHRFGIESQKPGKPWGEKHRFGIESEEHRSLSLIVYLKISKILPIFCKILLHL